STRHRDSPRPSKRFTTSPVDARRQPRPPRKTPRPRNPPCPNPRSPAISIAGRLWCRRKRKGRALQPVPIRRRRRPRPKPGPNSPRGPASSPRARIPGSILPEPRAGAGEECRPVHGGIVAPGREHDHGPGFDPPERLRAEAGQVPRNRKPDRGGRLGKEPHLAPCAVEADGEIHALPHAPEEVRVVRAILEQRAGCEMPADTDAGALRTGRDDEAVVHLPAVSLPAVPRRRQPANPSDGGAVRQFELSLKHFVREGSPPGPGVVLLPEERTKAPRRIRSRKMRAVVG